MTPTLFGGAARRMIVFAIAAVAASALRTPAAAAQQATTTGSVRGVVTGADGAPLSGATVLAINEASGVRRGTLTDERGRYQIPFLDPGAYTFRAQFIGYRPVEKPGHRIGIGQVSAVDFQLQQSAVQLETQEIVAEVEPLIETTKSGTSTRISESQIQDLPTNGRNFKDLTLLAPGVTEIGNTGSGGGQSYGGGRTGAVNILMDGVNNNESFFGGDARGGDRAPFSYSIEAVKEIQVITAGYDVERGSFTGGAVNAVTKSGTNTFSGAVFGYLRDDKLGDQWITARDFLGRRPVDFQKQQYGFSLGGPIIKDKAHFFIALDKQTANEPRPVFVTGPTDADVRASGINADTLANFLSIAQSRYGVELGNRVGQFAQNTDESAFFGRLDWQINDRNTLTLRNNYTKTNLSNDRLFIGPPTSTELLDNGGNNTDKANSFVASLTSLFDGGWSNEFRTQYATNRKPRPSNSTAQFDVPLPQVRINNIRSVLSDGSTTTTSLVFGADPILHNNNLETDVVEVINNLRWARGQHTYKLGGNFLRTHVYNRFWNNALGSFTFDNMQAFEAGTPSSFTRSLPYFGKEQIDDQDFSVFELAFYAQDEWQVSPRLFVTYGLRYDVNWFPEEAQANPLFSGAFPSLSNRSVPTDKNNVAPRVGFSFDPGADGRQIFRGGTGIFYGRAAYVLYGNALGATGLSQLSLNCTTGFAPTPDFEAYAEDQANIPTSCVGGGAAAAGTPQVNVFDDDFQQSYAWKTNLAYDRLITDNWRVTLEGVYSTIRDNYVLQDDNLNTVPRFYAEGEIPVYVDPATVSTTNGSVSRNNSRLDSRFAEVFVVRSIGSTLTYQGIVQLNGRHKYGSLYAAYTYDRTRDNASVGCCTISGMTRTNRVYGNPNDFDSQWGQMNDSRTHNIVVSPRFNLPLGIELSAIGRFFSGRPWTPMYRFDINGDGNTNDRVYVPTLEDINGGNIIIAAPSGGGLATGPQRAAQLSLLEQKIAGSDCLREYRGRVIDRNTCHHPWQKVIDMRVAKKFNTFGGQNFELVADFFNVLNGLDRDWGRRLEVPDDNQWLLQPAGFDATAKKFRYRVNEDFGETIPAVNFASQQFQMQLGMRYNF